MIPDEKPYLVYYSCFGTRLNVTFIQFFTYWFVPALLIAYIFLPISIEACIIVQIGCGIVYLIEWGVGRRNAKKISLKLLEKRKECPGI